MAAGSAADTDADMTIPKTTSQMERFIDHPLKKKL
jgi:hypothetical protein